eukprot:m51a1_g8655 putative importin subunit alpha-2-like (1742) ;mRNA; r:44229-60225
MEAAFAVANEASLVHYVLSSLDDAADDALQAANTKQLLCTGVNGAGPAFLIAGSVGTSASEAALATLLGSAGSDGVPVPFVGALTSSEKLRTRSLVLQSAVGKQGSARSGVALARAGGSDEISAIVAFLSQSWALQNRTSVFFQDTAFAHDAAGYLEAAVKTSSGVGLFSSAHSRVVVSQDNLGAMAVAAADSLCAHGDPKAVVLLAMGSMSAALVQEMARRNKSSIKYIAMSFVSVEEFAAAIPEPTWDLIDSLQYVFFFTQVVPLPTDSFSSYRIVTEYQKAMQKYKPGINFTHASLEGFIAGRLVTTAASTALDLNGWPLTRANFLDAIFRDIRTFKLFGKYTLGPYGDGVGIRGAAQTEEDWCNQGAHEVFMTQMDDGMLYNVDWWAFKFSGCSAKWNDTSAKTLVGYYSSRTTGWSDLRIGLSAAASAHNSDSSRPVALAAALKSDVEKALTLFQDREAVAIAALAENEVNNGVVNLFASYYQEARAAASFLAQKHDADRIIVLWSTATHFDAGKDFVDGLALCSARSLDSLPSINAVRQDFENWVSFIDQLQGQFEGFLIGRFISAVLESMNEEDPSKAGDVVTAESLLDAIYAKKYFKIDNKITFGPFFDQSSGERLCNQGRDTVYVTEWDGTAFNMINFQVREDRRCGIEFDPVEVHPKDDADRTVILATTIPGFAFVCSIVIAAIIVRSRGRSTLKKIKRSELEIGERIGKGQFGIVHNGDWHGTPVAIRVIEKSAVTQEDLCAVKSEMALTHSLHHPNLVMLLGYSETNNDLLIVSEYMASGSLHEYLKKNKRNMNYYNEVAIAFAAFAAANEASLVQFVLASLDDAYDDARQAENMKELLCTGANGTGPAFLIAGNVGSSASEAALDTLLEMTASDEVPVPFVGALSSSMKLRTRSSVMQSSRSGVALARPGGGDEVSAIVSFLSDSWKALNRTSVFFQDTPFAKDAVDYLKTGLKATSGANLLSSAHSPLVTSQADLSAMAAEAADVLCAGGDPRAVVLIAVESMSAAVIQEMTRRNKTQMMYFAMSFASAQEIHDALPDSMWQDFYLQQSFLFVTQVVPLPMFLDYRYRIVSSSPKSLVGFFQVDALSSMDLQIGLSSATRSHNSDGIVQVALTADRSQDIEGATAMMSERKAVAIAALDDWVSSVNYAQEPFEGFLIGKFISAVLESMSQEDPSKAGDAVTAESLLDAIYFKKYFKIDSKLTFGPFLDQSSSESVCNQGMDTVYVTEWDGTAFNIIDFARERSESSRRSRREQLVSSKRHRSNPDEEFGATPTPRTAADLRAAVAACGGAQGQGQGAAGRIEALRGLRRMLASEAGDDGACTAAVQTAIDAGAVQVLAGFLATSNDAMQLEAAWCITNLAAGTVDQAKALLETTPHLVLLLGGTSTALQEQAAWALANMSSDSSEMRDAVVRAGAVPALSALLRSRDVSVVRTAAFALTNLARGPDPDIDAFRAAGVAEPLPALVQSANEGVAVESLWLAAYMTARDPAFADAMLAAPGACEHLAGLLGPTTCSAQMIPALRVLGNIVCASDEATQALLAKCPSLLPTLLALLRTNEHRAVLKEAAWVVSNVAASRAHGQALLDAGFLGDLVRLVVGSQFEIRKEVAYALMNLSVDRAAMIAAVDQGALAGFFALLRAAPYDIEVAGMALSFIEMVLAAHPSGVRLVEEGGGIEAMETLQVHDNEGLYAQASALIDRYYSSVPEDCPMQQDVDYPPWRVGATASVQK